MASQPSVQGNKGTSGISWNGPKANSQQTASTGLYSEERKLLRIQAWEQRNQEVCQEKKGHPENAPLFGKPYKTTKRDELSCRIQRVLGSYEDGKDPDLNSGIFVKDLLGGANHASITTQSNQGQRTPTPDSARPSFHSGACPAPTSTPTESVAGGAVCPQPARNQHGASVTASRPSPSYLPEEARSSPCSPGRRDDEDILDTEYPRLPQMLTTLSPLAEIESPLHSSDGERFDRPRDANNRHGFALRPESPSPSLASPITALEMAESEPKQPPEDSRLPQGAKGATGPSQTFPPPLASKVSGVVVTQKPTAYVRPMDGQDQVIMESPELKPSPEPYEALPDKMNHNNNNTPSKTLPRILEARSNDAQCVEDILREMTRSWPPLLPTVRTPCASQPTRSPPAAPQAVEHVHIKHPGKEHYDSPPAESSVSSQQSSARALEAAHSSGVESASSSDSESSSGSESDSDGRGRQPLHRPGGSPAEVKSQAPHNDWQLANWIRSGQQNTGSASQTPPYKPPASDGRAADAPPTRAHKLHLSSDQGESSRGVDPPQRPQKHSTEPGVRQSPPDAKSSDAVAGGRAKTVGKKHSTKPGGTLSPERPEVAPRAETTQAGSAEDKTSTLTFSYRPKVKTKTKPSGGRKTESALLPEQKETFKRVPRVTVSGPRCPCGKLPPRCVCPATPGPGRPHRVFPAPSVEVSGACGVTTERARRLKGPKKAPTAVKPHAVRRPPGNPGLFTSLLVKIDLSLLSRVPSVSAVDQETTTTASSCTTTTTTSSSTTTTTSSSSSNKSVSEKGGKGSKPTKWGPTKNNRKRPAELDKNLPGKKQRLHQEAAPAGRAAITSESPANVVKDDKQKTVKKRAVPQQHCRDPKEQSTDARPANDCNPNPKHKKRTKKHKEHSKSGKKSVLTSVQPSTEPGKETSGTRPMLSFEDRRYPVKHYIKEAKKLKHKADTEADKVSKAFGYLEAAMFFAESGIAMETDPETSKSPYSMYEDTVELIKFTLKQKNSGDSSALSSENDFTVLCLKCQSFLQMAMFRCKHRVASKYSKTLKTHFKNSKPSPDASLAGAKSTDATSPRSNTASPALATSSSSGPGSNHSCGGGGGGGEGPASSSSSSSTTTTTTVSIPKIIHHVAFSYVNITALFVSAHDAWEKAEVLAHKSSGVLSELNAHMEPLSLSSSVTSMVRYTRQALHWMRLDALSIK